MNRARTWEGPDGQKYLGWNCPGCGDEHHVPVLINKKGPPNQGWNWNGDLESPTLSPSVSVKAGKYADPNWDPDPEFADEFKSYKCHFFIKSGQIQFCGDCTHSLKSQTIELPEIEKP